MRKAALFSLIGLMAAGAFIAAAVGCDEPGVSEGVSTVTYDANGATSGTPPRQRTVASGSVTTVAANNGVLNKTPYWFVRWNTRADGAGTAYKPGDLLTVEGDITLYVQWPYTVIYDPNGADTGWPPPSAVVGPGDKHTVSGNTDGLAKYDGTVFDGWNTRPSGGGTPYSAGALMTVNNNITLYAQWSPPAVYYHPNGATGGELPPNPQPGSATVTVAGNPGNLEKTGLEFNCWNTEPNGAGIDYDEGQTLNVDGIITLYAKWSYYLGGPGEAGGRIFYENPYYQTQGWRYLEAAPADVGSRHEWGGQGFGTNPYISCSTGTVVGTGKENTAELITHDHSNTAFGSHTHDAAWACADYRGGGYTDWFLPSKEELYLMFQNKDTIGGFTTGNYWSSSQYDDAMYAWYQNFSSGDQTTNAKLNQYNVRPARRF